MKTKVNFNGREVEAETVEAVNMTERWNEYILEDGTTLRVKLVLTGVYRICGELDPLGNPAYLVLTQNVLSVNTSDVKKAIGFKQN